MLQNEKVFNTYLDLSYSQTNYNRILLLHYERIEY